MSATEIPGQLNAAERQILINAIADRTQRPLIVLEVGTWLGGGSTVHLLRALQRNGEGHLWGIEANESTYQQMVANLRAAAPAALDRFTPLFGRSEDVIPQWLDDLGPEAKVDVVFLDGGDNPLEQITEFQLLDSHIPVGGELLSHDAKLRKGKWLVPYLRTLDHWECQLYDVSAEGLFHARKIAPAPSDESRRDAARLLGKLRRHPVELIGRMLPAPVCRLILAFLPRRLSARVTQGR